MLRRRWERAALALVLVALGACAGPPVPDAVRIAPPGDLQLAEVAPDPSRHIGRSVRWGGEVMAVSRDDAGNALVEVLGRRLDGDGQPYAAGPSDGRFHLRAAPSVDPALYRPGTALTVAGTVSGESAALDAPNSVPLVEVRAFMSWGPAWYPQPYYWHPHYPYYWHPYYPYRSHVHIGIGYGAHHHPYRFGHHHGYAW